MIRLQSPPGRYGLAAVCTLAVSLVYFVSHAVGVSSDLRYFGFTVAVLVSAIIGGLGPGLLATGLSGVLSAYLLLPPIFSFQIASSQRAGVLLLFVVEGVIVSLIGSMIRNYRATEIAVSWSEHYLVAVLFVSAATGLKLLGLRDLERDLPFTFMYAAVVGSAWTGGFGAGVMATLLASVSARFLFLYPTYSWSLSSGTTLTRLLLFVVEGIVISYLAAKHFEARRFVRSVAVRLRHLGRALQERADSTRALRTICGDAIWELKLGTNSETTAATGGQDRDPADAMEFTTWLKQIHPKDRLNAMTSLRSALEQGRTEWSYEYRRLRPGRGYVHVSDHAYIMRDDQWNPIRVVARSADQGELRRGSPVAETEGPYRALFENNPEAILLADRGLRIAEANDAACDLLGYRRPDLRWLNVENIIEERKRGLVMDKLVGLNMDDHSSTVFEVDCVRADGEVFRAKISAAVISQIEGSVVDRMITIEEIEDLEPSR